MSMAATRTGGRGRRARAASWAAYSSGVRAQGASLAASSRVASAPRSTAQAARPNEPLLIISRSGAMTSWAWGSWSRVLRRDSRAPTWRTRPGRDSRSSGAARSRGRITSTAMTTSAPMARATFDRERQREAAVHQEAAVEIDRGEDARHRHAGAHRAHQVAAGDGDGFAGAQVGGDGAEGGRQPVEAAGRGDQQLGDRQRERQLLAGDQAAGQDDAAAGEAELEVEQFGAVVELGAQGAVAAIGTVGEDVVPVERHQGRLDLGGGQADGVEPANHRAHARAGDEVDRDPQLLEDPEHPHVGEAAGAAAAEGEADARAAGRHLGLPLGALRHDRGAAAERLVRDRIDGPGDRRRVGGGRRDDGKTGRRGDGDGGERATGRAGGRAEATAPAAIVFTHGPIMTGGATLGNRGRGSVRRDGRVGGMRGPSLQRLLRRQSVCGRDGRAGRFRAEIVATTGCPDTSSGRADRVRRTAAHFLPP